MVVHLLVFLLSCRIQAVGAQMKLSPETLTVLRGEEARFTCSPNTQWTAMVWLLDGTVALTISKLHGVLPSTNTNVTAEKSQISKDSWVFVLKSTERNNQGQVTCDLQDFDRKTASLFVQEKGSVKVFGDNKLAFQGQSVLFECQAVGWYPEPRLQWQVNDRKVSQGEYNISSEESGKSLFTVSSNLSVTAAKSSYVCCLASVSALPTPLKSSVRLTVVAEVVQEGDDCTVPLAVTASLSALLLLLLLCICTVLCYRQRRQAKPSPQAAIWFDQSEVGKRSVAEVTAGEVNLGYSSEGPTDADYNELIMTTHSQKDFASFRKAPDVVHCSSLSVHSESQEEENYKNIKRITTV
ncbi:immunoglobulin superfamily member 5-like isoform X1 [Seriola lalandi dorsalis]|uniref:Immunoglobulin superfamily member 5-like n=2 Tax=Seriola lalandi dorsalis TaxID=1841481 RepID=A0A3B4Y184_SERLL|nr:immunoglobulin superfamily member 5-like isoform X1 [Seriola lalandi dorsalis]XP_056229349.1 immunoglobulin superfamily member 5 isoform X1 [Seriola aureovittata]